MADPKVSFDGPNQIVHILPGVTEIDVRVDMYSQWKVWRIESVDNAKWPAAFTMEGGTPIDDIGEQFSTMFFFLANGWTISCDTGEQVYIKTNLLRDAITGAQDILDLSNNSNVTIEVSKAVTIVVQENEAIAQILQSLTDIKIQTDQITFINGDVVATLDGEEVTTDKASRNASKAKFIP